MIILKYYNKGERTIYSTFCLDVKFLLFAINTDTDIFKVEFCRGSGVGGWIVRTDRFCDRKCPFLEIA